VLHVPSIQSSLICCVTFRKIGMVCLTIVGTITGSGRALQHSTEDNGMYPRQQILLPAISSLKITPDISISLPSSLLPCESTTEVIIASNRVRRKRSWPVSELYHRIRLEGKRKTTKIILSLDIQCPARESKLIFCVSWTHSSFVEFSRSTK